MRGPDIHIDRVCKAIAGTASPVLGVITSFQEQVEWHLWVASQTVCLTVSVSGDHLCRNALGGRDVEVEVAAVDFLVQPK